MGSRGRGAIAAIVLLALLGAVGYTAVAGATVYQDLEHGRQALVAAQTSMSAATRAADSGPLQAAAVAIQVAALQQKYAGRALTPDDLQTLLQQAHGIATDYSASTQAIGQQLRAARSERAQVKTTDRVGPPRDAYREVDRALAEADTAFSATRMSGR